MGRRILLILWTLAAAVGAYFLRAGDLSLPVFAHYEGIALWALLGITVLLTALLALPEKGGWQFSELRPLPLAIALQGSGALLICVSAAWQLYRLFPVLRSFAAITAAVLGAIASGTYFPNDCTRTLLSLAVIAPVATIPVAIVVCIYVTSLYRNSSAKE